MAKVFKSIAIVFQNDMPLRGFEDKEEAEKYKKAEEDKHYTEISNARSMRMKVHFNIQSVLVEMKDVSD